MRSVYSKALWDQRKSLPTWGSGLALVIFLEAALWPSIQAMPSLDAYLRDFPAGLKEVFSIDQMTTGQGFLNAELFTLVLPMMFLIYGISRGARMVAGEEDSGTLDLLLVTSLSTTRLLVEETLALVTGVAVLGAVVLTFTVAGSRAFDLGVSPLAALSGALAQTLLGVEFGVVALVTGALTGRRGLAVAAAAALALLSYVLFVGGLLVEGLSDWRAWSPFQQALHSGPLSDSIPGSFLGLALVPLALVVAALPVWARRDIGAAR
jgi:ABC-2 type transport system permease protein